MTLTPACVGLLLDTGAGGGVDRVDDQDLDALTDHVLRDRGELVLVALGVLDVGRDAGGLERLGEQRRVVERVAGRRRGVRQDHADLAGGLAEAPTVVGSLAPLVGGLSRLHAAVTPPPLEPPEVGVLLLSEPQAVRLSAAATPRIPIEAVVLRIRLRLPSGGTACTAAPVYVSCANISGKNPRWLETFINLSPECQVTVGDRLPLASPLPSSREWHHRQSVPRGPGAPAATERTSSGGRRR